MAGFGPAQGGLSTGVSSAAFPLLAPNGSAAAPSIAAASYTTTGLYWNSTPALFATVGGTTYLKILSTATVGIQFALSSDVLNVSPDVFIARDAAAVLALKNGTTAQEFRVYGTTTGPKYLSLSHNGTIAIVDSSPNTDGVRLGSTSGKVGFYGTAPIAKQTGVAVDAAGIHAALVALGLIAA